MNPKFDNDNLPCRVADFNINIRHLWSIIDKKYAEFNINNWPQMSDILKLIFIQIEPVKCHQQLNCLRSWLLYICGLLLIWKSAVCHISNNLHMSKDFKLVFQPNWNLLVSSTAYLSERLNLISTLYICGLLLIWMSVDYHINCISQHMSNFQACFSTKLNSVSAINSLPVWGAGFNINIIHLWSTVDVNVSWLSYQLYITTNIWFSSLF